MTPTKITDTSVPVSAAIITLEPTVVQETCMTLPEPQSMSSDALADVVIEGVRKFQHYLPHLIALKKRFDTGERDSLNRLKIPIKECSSWKEFCKRILNRTPEAIRQACAVKSSTPKLPKPEGLPDWRYEEYLTRDAATELYKKMVNLPEWQSHRADGPTASAIYYGLSYTSEGSGARNGEIPEIPSFLRDIANKIAAKVGMPVNYIQCHKYGTDCEVIPHPDPKGMIVPMLIVGQERTFRVGGKIFGKNGKPFPPMASQESMVNGTHVPEEEILLRHGSLLIFNGGRTLHSMLPAAQDEKFNPNDFEWRISILFRWTTPAMREFGTRGAIEHGSLEQYEAVKTEYRDQLVVPAVIKASEPKKDTPSQVTDAEFAQYEAEYNNDIRKTARNLLDHKGMTPADVVGALVGMSFSKPMAEAAVRIVVAEQQPTDLPAPTTTTTTAPKPPKNPELVAAILAHEKAAKYLKSLLQINGIDADVSRSRSDGKFHVVWHDATADQIYKFAETFKS